MKILKPAKIKDIPDRTPGDGTRVNSSFYDEVARKVGRLSETKCLPIECQSIDDCYKLQYAIRVRGYQSIRRRMTVYAF